MFSNFNISFISRNKIRITFFIQKSMGKSTAEIRQIFLDFFHNKGHQIVTSSSLVQNKDPTLLFTNAGMNQFKDVFLGINKRSYSRATTSQRCVRAGGKHNDLENVGYTTRHHTFFEMLGNFSFGDYFKQDAIQYAWELLTEKKFFNLSKEHLLVTVYKTDNETYEVWRKIGIAHNRIIRIGDNKGKLYSSDNFWQMGDTGPCGPCTEIFYDRNNLIQKQSQTNISERDNDRYIEIWNIVFMQFNRKDDGSLELLPKPSVDTGMGLERIAAVLQNVHSNYEIDIFRTLIKAIAEIIGITDLGNKSLCVIADHIRSCSFLIADGVIPSNENHGYVLRRIIRRAIRHCNMLGVKNIFFYKLVNPLIEVMGTIGENLKQHQTQIEQVLKTEEELFSHTLERGLTLLDKELAKRKENILDGTTVFRLYDTYGFPIDLTKDICRERNIQIDTVGFETAMQKQRIRARQHSDFFVNYNNIMHINYVSEFHGYNYLALHSSVVAIFVNGKPIEKISIEKEAIVILDKTPFYAESGGQVGDSGKLNGQNFNFVVNDTQKYSKAIGHIGNLTFGSLKVGDRVQAQVDEARRIRIRINHSATHLLHAALREVIGKHVLQKGSFINDKVLRFDFSHFQAMKITEINEVENLVNTKIRCNIPIKADIMDLKNAKLKGVITLPNEKYDEKNIRVLSIGDFSTELCIGDHVLRTGDIGLFFILSEFSKATGVRRIEAVTGEVAIANLHMQRDQLRNIAKCTGSNNYDLCNKVYNILQHTRKVEKKLQQLKERIISQEITNLPNKTVEVKGIKLMVSQLEDVESKTLRTIVNSIKNQSSSSIIVLVTTVKDKISLVIGVSQNIIHHVKAAELANFISQKINGKGGGSSDIAQANGTNIVALPVILSMITNWINMRL